tara:strand:- start:159 stop:482 length:324 start_codon:yes stop_codon:yes gene_type:complete
MIIALHISIALNLLALGLIFWFRKDQQMSNDLHEAEINHTHQGMNALMNDFNNYQVTTDRKITELEKQLIVKSKENERMIMKLTESLPLVIRKVVGHIEFAKPLDKK